MTSKIAVIGAVNGKIKAVFSKLATLHAKNRFSLAIVSGDLFADDPANPDSTSEVQSLLDGQIEVPLPTYFAIGTRHVPEEVVARLGKDGEVCNNLFCLGRRTTIKTSECVRLVALGGSFALSTGKEVDEPPPGEYTPGYTERDAKALGGASSADILITSDWPKGITAGSAVQNGGSAGTREQQCIAELALQLKPRYHFSTSAGFYEREPYFYQQDPDSPGYAITRFISLAAYGNENKQKWIYAFNLESKPGPLLASPPAGATACPLTASIRSKRKLPDQNQAFSRFSGGSNGYSSSSGHANKKSRHHAPPLPSECFFCLSNPTAATHIIGSIGDSSYVTSAKGPLSTRDTFPTLGNIPGHMLIIPLEHSSSLAAMADSESRRQTLAEMHRYRRALHRMVVKLSSSTSKEPAASEGGQQADDPGPSTTQQQQQQRLGSVTWAISRAAGIHMHWQFLPLPGDMIVKGLAEAAWKVQAENESYPRFEVRREDAGVDGRDHADKNDDGDEWDERDHLRVWITAPTDQDGGDQNSGDDDDLDDEAVRDKETVLTLPLDAGFRFDLQFGRKVMAKLLGLESRGDWRLCQQSVEEETEDAEAFKRAFKKFDFTLGDD